MEQIKKIGKIAETLGDLQDVLKDVDLSGLKVAANINKEIKELEQEFNDEIKDNHFLKEYELERDYTFEKIEAEDESLEQLLFKEVFESVTQYGECYETMSEVISEIDGLGREYRNTRCEIDRLKALLK